MQTWQSLVLCGHARSCCGCSKSGWWMSNALFCTKHAPQQPEQPTARCERQTCMYSFQAIYHYHVDALQVSPQVYHHTMEMLCKCIIHFMGDFFASRSRLGTSQRRKR